MEMKVDRCKRNPIPGSYTVYPMDVVIQNNYSDIITK